MRHTKGFQARQIGEVEGEEALRDDARVDAGDDQDAWGARARVAVGAEEVGWALVSGFGIHGIALHEPVDWHGHLGGEGGSEGAGLDARFEMGRGFEVESLIEGFGDSHWSRELIYGRMDVNLYTSQGLDLLQPAYCGHVLQSRHPQRRRRTSEVRAKGRPCLPRTALPSRLKVVAF